MVMEQEGLRWRLVISNDGGRTLHTVWSNQRYKAIKEEIIGPDGIDTDYGILGTDLAVFGSCKELRKALGLV